jgi:hypothetical protein
MNGVRSNPLGSDPRKRTDDQRSDFLKPDYGSDLASSG